MIIIDNKSVISTKFLINCLKLFQEYPDQCPPDVRAKFCNCTRPKCTLAVHIKDSKEHDKMNPRKIILQESSEFLSMDSKSTNDLNQLITLIQQLRETIRPKFKTEITTNNSNWIPSDSKNEEQHADIWRTMNYLIDHSNQVPMETMNHLWKIMTSLLVHQLKFIELTRKICTRKSIMNNINPTTCPLKHKIKKERKRNIFSF